MLLNWHCHTVLEQAPLTCSCPEFIRPLFYLRPLEILHTNKILTNLHPRWGVSGSCCYRNPLPSPGSRLQLRNERLEASSDPSPDGTGMSCVAWLVPRGLNPALLPEVLLQQGCMEDAVATTTSSQPQESHLPLGPAFCTLHH